jgi:PhzF family phenazine biosynthesis protein
MKIPIYQVDAFASRVFKGNPAAICILPDWLPDPVMQNVAFENNLAETAFLVRKETGYHLRWFTPKVEVDLCGHATLATAYVVFNFLKPGVSSVDFQTKSGTLSVARTNDLFTMDFPARPPHPIEMPHHLVEALGKQPKSILLSRDLLVIYDTEEDIRSIRPDLGKLMAVKEGLGVIISAKGNQVDFVSRFFAPKVGIPEDPVTGSSHCTLIPYWARQLQKHKLHAYQLSEREGELFCEYNDPRVRIGGNAFLYLSGEIFLDS